MGEAAQRKGPAYSLMLGLCCYLSTKRAYGLARGLSIDYWPYCWPPVSSEGLAFLGAVSYPVLGLLRVSVQMSHQCA